MIQMLNAGMGSWTDQQIEIYSKKNGNMPHEWYECGVETHQDWPWHKRLREFIEKRPTEWQVNKTWIIVLCCRKLGGLRKAIDTGAFQISELLQMLGALEKSPITYHVFLQ